MSSPNVIMKIEYAPPEESMGSYTPFQQKKFSRARKYYGCGHSNSKRNYVDYVNDGSKEKIDYVAYSGNEEKSYGVFGKNGLMDEKQQAILKKQLRNTKSVIWYGFISFTTEFGNKYVKDHEDAYHLMTAEFPKFFRSAGLNPDNITWYAGLHENTLHRHIHFSFFENEPMKYTARDRKKTRFSEGHIHKGALDRFKVHIEQRLTDIKAEIKRSRSFLTNLMQNVLFSGEHKQRLTKEIQEQIAELAEVLPKDGRLSYASENMAHLRPKINGIVDRIIRQSKQFYDAFNTFVNAAVNHDERINKMQDSQKIDKRYRNKDLVADKVLEDMYRRLGNYVINTARAFKNKEKPTAVRVVRKKAKKQSTASLMTHCLNLSAYAEREAMDFFREYMAKLKEEEIRSANRNEKEKQPQNESEME